MGSSNLITGAVVGVAALFGISAQSHAADLYWYAGLGPTYTMYDEDLNFGGGLNDSFKDSAPGASVFAGFESLLPNTRGLSVGVDLELSWSDALEDDPFGFDSELDLMGLNLASKFYIPVDRNGVFRVNLLAGLNVTRHELKGLVFDKGTDVYSQFGLGFDLRVAKGVRLGLDNRYTIVDGADLITSGLRAQFYF